MWAVDVHTSRGDGWELAWRRPRSVGARAQYYAGFAEQLDQPRRTVEWATPCARVVMVFDATMTVTTSTPTGAAHVGAFVAGPRAAPLFVDQHGSFRGVEIGLAAQDAASFLGTALGDLDERVVPLDELIGRRAEEIHDRLAMTPDWADVFDIIDGYFQPSGGSPVDPRLCWAWDIIERHQGRVRVESIAQEIGWSRRHFAAKFDRAFGVTPKVAARLFRFESATRLLRNGLAPARVAVDCGYFDQAHMHRDFAGFAECTPGAVSAANGTGGGLGSAWPPEGM